MPSQFSSLASSARQAHSDVFGETTTVTITVGSAAPVSAAAVLHKVRTVTRKIGGDVIRVTVRTCRFPTLTSIDHTAIVTINGQRWAIDEVMDQQASGLNVQLIQQKTHSHGRNGYRGESAAANVSSRRGD